MITNGKMNKFECLQICGLVKIKYTNRWINYCIYKIDQYTLCNFR